MGKDSGIQWTNNTFNGWEGCTKVSAGCALCYAEARNARFAGKDNPAPNWGMGKPRRRTSDHNWNDPIRWNRDAKPGHVGNLVFCSSLADWLDDEVDPEWLFDLITMIVRTPNLTWQLLTKRPENFESRLTAAMNCSAHDPLDIRDRIEAWMKGERMLQNVMVGATMEDQTNARKRIQPLLAIPARWHFASCEPLIGPVDLTMINPTSSFSPPTVNALTGETFWPDAQEIHAKINWVIAGGESAQPWQTPRRMMPEWARSLRDQCKEYGTAFFFKQWGDYNEAGERVGKKKSGSLLDGEEHTDFPFPITLT